MNNVLIWNLRQIQYYDHTVKITSFSSSVYDKNTHIIVETYEKRDIKQTHTTKLNFD